MITAKVLKYRSQSGPIASVPLPSSILNDPHLAGILGSLTTPSTPPGAAAGATAAADMGRSQLSMNDNDDIITDAGGDEEEEDGDEIEDSDDI
jgi:hypothetical protein